MLIVERGKGSRGIWSLPGGHIEPGELAREAARREVLEETGVAAEIGGLVDVHDVHIRSGPGTPLTAHYVLCVYWGRWIAGEPAAASDAAAARFVDPAELRAYTLTAGVEPLIRRALSALTAKPFPS